MLEARVGDGVGADVRVVGVDRDAPLRPRFPFDPFLEFFFLIAMVKTYAWSQL